MNKIYKIITCEKFAVVISDEEIKSGDWFLGTDGALKLNMYKSMLITKNYIHHINSSLMFPKDKCKKVIATISPFKIEGLPILELPNKNEVTGTDDNRSKPNYCYAKIEQGEEKGCIFPACHCGLPNQEEDVEKLAKQEFPLLNTENDRTGEIEEENLQLLGHRRTFIKGYKAAQNKLKK